MSKKTNIGEFKKKCAGKIKHKYKSSADKAIETIRPEKGFIIESYLCKFCNHYHTGRTRINNI